MSTVSHAPCFSLADARRLAADLYDLEGNLNPLPSERDQNFHLVPPEGPSFVLKIANGADQEEILDLQNQAMEHLAASGIPVPSPRLVNTRTGETMTKVRHESGMEHYVRMVTFLPGTPLAKVTPPADELFLELGKVFGHLSQALAGFDHPSAHRELIWSMEMSPRVVTEYLSHIQDSQKRERILAFLEIYKSIVEPQLDRLLRRIIHNDGNDYNIIVSPPDPSAEAFGRRSIAGLVDFGDMVHSFRVAELAVTCAYAMLDKSDPLSTAGHIVRGFHSIQPLDDEELSVLFPMICQRLCMSVSISAYQKTLQPDNEYLTISENPSWKLLARLQDIHPRMAEYSFRAACEQPPCPDSGKVVQWLRNHQSTFSPLMGRQLRPGNTTVLDLSVGSLQLDDMSLTDDSEALTRHVAQRLADAGADFGIGRYDEVRLLYTGDQFRSGEEETAEGRTLHIGLDVFTRAGTPVHAPMDGIIHSFHVNDLPRDYGPTLILEHQVDEGKLTFYSLYGHLSNDSLSGIAVGQSVHAGQVIAKVGDRPGNGDWPPHLHFQLITDMLGNQGDFSGVASYSQRSMWKSICPDPNLVLGFPEEELCDRTLTSEEIVQLRQAHLGHSLSTSYRKHLKMVRGAGQYLYEHTGRAYLDAVNNVPHVGHSHPKVVRAAREQMAVLNTNTRYLHDNLVRYTRRLCDTLPDPLQVCFIVNSGSEANDLALRLAWNYTRRRDVIAVDGAYHGNLSSLIDISPYKFDGLGGSGCPPHTHISVMPDPYQGAYRYGDPVAGAKYAEHVHILVEQLQAQGRPPAAFICESLLGCGGQIVLPPRYFREAYHHVREAGGVCIADEVQVGFGRVGTHFWGFETQDVVPDIVTLGKPIGDGHPLAAVITTPDIARSFANGMEYFNTFGGNPVSCAVGLAVLDIIEEENLQQNALSVGRHLLDGLHHLQERYLLIGDVRGMGLFIGAELVLDRETRESAPRHASYIAERMKEEGILISTDGPRHNVLKIKPPMVFTRENADRLVTTLDRILAEDPVRL